MSQVSRRKMKPEVEERISQVFVDVLTSAQFAKHQSSFVELFMTPTEKIMFAKRVAIAILAKRGYSYDLIKDYLKVSQGAVAGIVNQLAVTPKGQQEILEKIIHDKQMREILSEFEYHLRELMPPKGRDWSIWRTNLENDKRTNDIPI